MADKLPLGIHKEEIEKDSSKEIFDILSKQQENLKKIEQILEKTYKEREDFVKDLQESGYKTEEIEASLHQHYDVTLKNQEKEYEKRKQDLLSTLEVIKQTKEEEGEQYSEQIQEVEKSLKDTKKLVDRLPESFTKGVSTLSTSLVDVALGPVKLITGPLEEMFGFKTVDTIKNAFSSIPKLFNKEDKKDTEDDPTADFLEKEVKAKERDLLRSGVIGASAVFISKSLEGLSGGGDSLGGADSGGSLLDKLPLGKVPSSALAMVGKALPYVAIAGLVVGATALLVNAWKNDWEDQGEEEAQKLKDVFADENATLLDKVKATGIFTIKGIFGSIVGGLKEGWESIKGTFQGILDIWGDEDLSTAEKIIGTIKTAVQGVLEFPWKVIKGFWKTLESYILPLLPESWQEKYEDFKDKLTPIVTKIKDFVLFIPNAIKDAFVALKDFFLDKVEEFKSIWGDEDLSLWDKVKQTVISIVTTPIEALKTFWGTLWTSIKTKFNEIFPNAETKWIEIKERIKTFFTDTWASVVGFFTNLKENAGPRISEVVLNIDEKITEIKEKVAFFFVNSWNNIVGFFTTLKETAWDRIKEAVLNIDEKITDIKEKVSFFFVNSWSNIVGFFTTLKENASARILEVVLNVDEKITEVKEKVAFFFTNAWSNIVGFFTSLKENASTKILEVVLNIDEKVTEVKEKVSFFFVNAWNNIIGFFSNLKENASAKILEVVLDIDEKFIEIKDKVFSFFTNSWSSIIEFFTNLKDNAKTNIQESVLNIEEKFIEIKNKVASFFTNSWEGITSFFSGLRDNAEQKILEVAFNVDEKFTEVKEKVTTFFSNAWEGVIGKFENLTSGIKERISNIKDLWSDEDISIFDKIKDTIKEVIGGYVEAFVNFWKGLGSSILDILPNWVKKLFGFGNKEELAEERKEVSKQTEEAKNQASLTTPVTESLVSTPSVPSVEVNGRTITGLPGMSSWRWVNDSIIYKDGEVFVPHPGDTILTTKNTPVVLPESRNNSSLTAPISQYHEKEITNLIQKEFFEERKREDAPVFNSMVSLLERIAELLKDKEMTPFVQQINQSGSINFDSLRI
jgi:phage-related protein